MRYAIYDTNGNIKNTFVCDDPVFAAKHGGVEYPYPKEADPNPPEPTAEDIMLDLLSDHEYRLCMSELTGGETV